MAQKQEIEISISPDGHIEYTIKGIKGNACENLAEILNALGQVEHEENTSEYYEKGQDVGIHIQH